jgi:hypothetical protein
MSECFVLFLFFHGFFSHGCVDNQGLTVSCVKEELWSYLCIQLTVCSLTTEREYHFDLIILVL